MLETTKLYRYFDAAGALLRLAQHEADKTWQADISSVRIETFPDRAAAHAAERAAISSENPAHNLVRYSGPAATRSKARVARVELSPEEHNARCRAALISMYEETHWTDFLGKHREGNEITFVFRRRERMDALAEGWWKSIGYRFRSGGRAITGSHSWNEDETTMGILIERCDPSKLAEYGLQQ